MNKPIKLGVVGCGRWGPSHIRNFIFLKECEVKYVCDINNSRLNYIKELYPQIKVTTNYQDLIKDEEVEALVISTPTSTHYELVRLGLENGKDILCEKPFTDSSKKASQLVELANKHKKILMVGYVFLYNDSISALKNIINSGELGKLYYARAARTNLGPIRSDINSVGDLATHDISIFNFVLSSLPVEVHAYGARFLQNQEDIAFITITYANNMVINILVSWLDPRKIREITIVGDKKMIVWDELDREGPIKIYERTVVREDYHSDFGEFQLLIKDKGFSVPTLKLQEPVRNEAKAFIQALMTRTTPVSNGEFAVNILKVYEAINESIRLKGAPVKL